MVGRLGTLPKAALGRKLPLDNDRNSGRHHPRDRIYRGDLANRSESRTGHRRCLTLPFPCR